MRIKSNKHNRRFHLQYYDSKGQGFWRALGLKIEVSQPSVKIQVVTCGQPFNLEIFRVCPFEEEEIGRSKEEVLKIHGTFNLRMGDLSTSILHLRDLIQEKELEKLEKKHTKVRCTDEELDNLLKEMDMFEPSIMDCPSPGPANTGFIESTFKKGSKSETKQSAAKKTAFHLGMRLCRHSEDRSERCANVIQENSENEEELICVPKRRPGLFRESEMSSEETSNTLNLPKKLKECKENQTPKKDDEIYDKLESLKKIKRCEYERKSRKPSQAIKEPTEEDIFCCVCHSKPI